LKILQPLSQKTNISLDDVEAAAKKITSNPDKYIKKDPLHLVMMERDDFTNFLVFFEQNNKNTDLIASVLEFNPNIPSLVVSDEYAT